MRRREPRRLGGAEVSHIGELMLTAAQSSSVSSGPQVRSWLCRHDDAREAQRELSAGYHYSPGGPSLALLSGVIAHCRPAFLLLIVFAIAGSACAAGALPPSRTDVGTMVAKPTGEIQTGFRVSTGAHWASATHDKLVDYDVGAGYVYERSEASGGDITDKHTSGDAPDTSNVAHGGYLSLERVLSRSLRNKQRTWLGMRVEYLDGKDDSKSSISALARINWEVFGHVEGAGASDTNCGGAFGIGYGTAAVGFYGEAGARRSLEGDASFVATLGLSIRLPFLAGVVFDLCPN
jgi:hypothetical protein